MVQRIAPLFQWKIESGQWKIVLNNFPLSIIHFQLKKGRVQFFAPKTNIYNYLRSILIPTTKSFLIN